MNQAPQHWGWAAGALALGAGAVFCFFELSWKVYAGQTVEYGFSAYTPGSFELVFLYWFTALAVLATLGLTAGLALLIPETFKFLPPMRPAWSRMLVLAGAALGAGLVLAAKFVVLQKSPTMDEENIYHFTAQLLAQGRLVLRTDLPAELFDGRFGLVHEADRWYGMYPYGWPLLLALGYLARAPWLVNPLFAVLILLLAAALARHAYGAGPATLALVLLALSPFFVLTSATDLSEPASAAGVFAALLCLLRYFKDDRVLWLPLGGAAAGLAFLTRELTAMALLSPWLFYLVWQVWRQHRLRRLAALATPLLAALAIYLAINWRLTGDLFEPGYQAYLRTHGILVRTLGFGSDYRYVGGIGVHTVSLGVLNSFFNLVRLNYWLLGWPLSLFLVCWTPWNTWTKLTLAGVGLQLTLSTTAFHPGLCVTGPVDYFEASCLLVVLAAAGMARLAAWYEALPAARAAPHAVPALLVVILAVNLAMFTPVQLRSLHAMSQGVGLLYNTLRNAGVHRAVVFVKNVQPPYVPGDRMRSNVDHVKTNASLDDDVILANDLGAEQNRAAWQQYFSGRSAFYYQIGPDWKPRLETLK